MNRGTCVAVLCVFIGVGSAALAHKGAEGIVRERMHAMKDMSERSKRLGAMFKGRTPLDAGYLRDSARAYISHAQDIPEQFPDTEQSRHGASSEALQSIWRDWRKFVQLAERMEQHSGTLLALLDGGAGQRELRSAFGEIAKSCKSCHREFRRKKK